MENNEIIQKKYHVDDQRQWVESLSASQLKDWLRRFIWRHEYFPLDIPYIISNPISHLATLLQAGSPQLIVNLRIILPELLKEWGSYDPAECLESLLNLCASLRCAEAESVVIQITQERLGARQREVEIALRQRCLRVLSGFGCSSGTAAIFKKYIKEINYAAICYRALYRYQRDYAATLLAFLADLYEKNSLLDDLKDILNILLFDYLTEPEERSVLWMQVLLLTEKKNIDGMLVKLETIGIDFLPPEFDYSNSSEDTSSVEAFRVKYNIQKGWHSENPDLIEIENLLEQDDSVVSLIYGWHKEHAPEKSELAMAVSST